MDSQRMTDIKEIKTTTKFILKRLNKLTGCGEACTCASELVELKKNFGDAEVRMNELQQNIKGLQTEENDEHRFNQIQDKLAELEKSLLALHTGNTQPSKHIPSASEGQASNGASSSVLILGSMAFSNQESTPASSTGAVWRAHESSNYPLNITHQSTRNGTRDHRSTLSRTSLSSSTAPNVSRKPSASTSTDRSETSMIRQTDPDFVYGDYWKAMWHRELENAKQITREDESIRTVLCLDISESMASGNAWSQAKQFVNDFLNGLDMMTAQFGHFGLAREYVGIATFGHETKLQQLATSNYTYIREKMDHLQLGGPSPLFGGLWLSAAGTMCCKAIAGTGSGIIISPRIIVITDGKPTETGLRGGPDRPAKSDETWISLMSCLEEIEYTGTSVFFVGVWDFDKDFLKLISASEGRKKLFGYLDGQRLARRTYLCTKASLFDDSSDFMLSSFGLSMDDEEDVRDIRADSLSRLNRKDKLRAKVYTESKNTSFPVIGSRVRRGPDWMWNIQDNYGVGTVVGHSEEDCTVWVTWDFDGLTTYYRYGNGTYDLLVTDEPRELKPGQKMAVGCQVKPGRDARMLDARWSDISFSTQGVVVRMESKTAHVRWDNGKRGAYSYGADGRYEIELCTSSEGQMRNLSSYTSASSTTFASYFTRANKNKNKHVNE